MIKWEEKRLGEIVDLIDGDRGVNYPKKHEMFDNGYCLFLNTSNVTTKGFSFQCNSFITKEKDNLLRKGKLERKDIVITTRGTVGNVAIYRESIKYENIRINSGMVLLRSNLKYVIPEYLYQLLKTKYLRAFLLLYSSGSAQPQLPIKDLTKIKISLPPLKIQQKIADILSVYDELVENNNRRLQLLEKASLQIYKEWFVRMRFPGYKNTNFENGIPQGWRLTKLSELVTTQYGYTTSAELEEVGPKFLRITDIAERNLVWDNVPYCRIEGKELLKYLIEPGDILVARTGATVGYAKMINKNSPEAVFASFLVRLKPKDKELRIMIGMIVESQEYKKFIQAISTGAAQPQANAQLLTLFSMVVPDKKTINMFNTYVEPIKDQIEMLLLENQNLIKQRDLLLPRIMSGKLEI